jgi:hypothetical protein
VLAVAWAAWSPSTAVAQVADDDPTVGFDFRRARYTGAGLINGSFLSGLSVKHHVTDQHAVQVALGAAWGAFRYWPNTGVGLAVDYVHHPETVFDSPHVRLGWNIGIGVDARFYPSVDDFDFAAGVHFVAGFEVLLVDAPVDLAIEYRPGVVGRPGPGGLAFAFGDVAAHIRWWVRPRRARTTENEAARSVDILSSGDKLPPDP